MPDLITSNKNEIIKQSNVLTTAAYSLAKNEKRLVYLALNAIHKGEAKQNELGSFPVEIHHSDYSELYTIKMDTACRDIRNAAKSLNQKEVIFYLPDEDLDDEKALDAISWTVKRSHRPKRGVTILHFNAELLHVIKNVDNNFTRLLKGDISKLEKPCSMRLYDSMMQWVVKGEVTFSIEWMINRYELPIKYLERMSDFRRRFLKPAVDEINEKTSISVSYEEIKGKGKRAKPSSIKFEITSKLLPEKIINNTASTLEDAVKTYCELNDQICLPSKKEIENLERFISELVLEGFDMGLDFGQKLKAAKAALIE